MGASNVIAALITKEHTFTLRGQLQRNHQLLFDHDLRSVPRAKHVEVIEAAEEPVKKALATIVWDAVAEESKGTFLETRHSLTNAITTTTGANVSKQTDHYVLCPMFEGVGANFSSDTMAVEEVKKATDIIPPLRQANQVHGLAEGGLS